MRKIFWAAITVTALAIGLFGVALANTSRAATVTGQVQSIKTASQCLDNSNFGWHAGNPLQVWACGAVAHGVAGADQQFTFDNSLNELQAIAPSGVTGTPPGGWCVTTAVQGAALTIQACGASQFQANQDVIEFDNVYEFVNTGLVMDASGKSTANGTKVQGWTLNDGTNQQWTLPTGP